MKPQLSSVFSVLSCTFLFCQASAFMGQCLGFTLEVPAHCCLAKTRSWKPSQAQFDEPRSPSVALRCGQTSTRSCQVSRTESLSRSLALLRCDARLSLPLRSSSRLHQVRAAPAQDRAELQPRQSAGVTPSSGPVWRRWLGLPRSLARGAHARSWRAVFMLAPRDTGRLSSGSLYILLLLTRKLWTGSLG